MSALSSSHSTARRLAPSPPLQPAKGVEARRGEEYDDCALTGAAGDNEAGCGCRPDSALDCCTDPNKYAGKPAVAAASAAQVRTTVSSTTSRRHLPAQQRFPW